ncbi:unnamed protein product [Coffea canephora]|uniref:DH200=94 genomic scaffold, scaffold_133 n=1 Tax=Coffea canephora TaxID=49390 RepID=A0A068V711_COFCA|nr:unnamed protein product [Coffea canephora]
MGKMPHVTLSKFAQTYGPLMSLKLGTQYVVVVGSSPAAAIEILKTHDQIYPSGTFPRFLQLQRKNSTLATAPNVSDFYLVLSKLDLQGLRKKSIELGIKIRAVWEPIIEKRRKHDVPLSQQDFLDTLLQNNFTNERIHQLLMELFTAGTDTSASTIEWTMAELVKNSESMKEVCEELEREINEDMPKESHLMHLPYLQACIKETLRLHPPAPLLLPHRAPETYPQKLDMQEKFGVTLQKERPLLLIPKSRI